MEESPIKYAIKNTLRLSGLLTAALSLTFPVHAEIANVFGGQLTCSVGGDGVRTCQGVVELPNRQAVLPVDSPIVPIDVNLFIPPEPEVGDDGNFPIIGMFHGWGGSKLGRNDRFLNQGYVFFSISDRGWGNSCGGFDPKRGTGNDCQHGYNHLMDTRFEVHDVQTLLGMLADEGVIDPSKIGVTGGSYGGGISYALAALNNRQMPVDYEQGDELVPWVSPINSIPMSIAAAAPDIPWSDLVYSLVPNGWTLDYVKESPYLRPDGEGRIGIMKQSFVSGFYGIGLATSNYAPAGTDPDADLNTWYSAITGGEPYDENPTTGDFVEEVLTHHSAFYIENSVKPPPMFISNGFTDDIFPPDEALRFYNKAIADHPDANIQLFFSDHGHQRGQNKGPEVNDRLARRDAWLAHFVKGEGPLPVNEATVWTQECGADSQGPFTAATWDDLPQSEIRFLGGATATLISPEAGNPDVGRAYDPIAGGGACATADATDQPGLANFRLPAAPAGGYTLVGSPTVIVDILNPSPNSQIAARLIDVAPDGSGTLIARGLYRPNLTLGPDTYRGVFQLHPNAYRFEEGHVAKLELMPNDKPYGRPSNGQGPITVSNLDFRMPILEGTGTANSTYFAPKCLPPSYELATDVDELGEFDCDGIAGPADACPDEFGPENENPFFNGCATLPTDSDNDGIPDGSDACPNEAGEASNGGCPITDSDGDGIDDVDDDCPNEPGPIETNGCPNTPGGVEPKNDPEQTVQLSAGESGVVGTLEFTNNSGDTHTLSTITINLDEPAAVSELSLSSGGATFSCQPAQPATENICTANPGLSIAPGSTISIDVNATAPGE